jgi:hypothetical protein
LRPPHIGGFRPPHIGGWRPHFPSRPHSTINTAL